MIDAGQSPSLPSRASSFFQNRTGKEIRDYFKLNIDLLRTFKFQQSDVIKYFEDASKFPC